MEQDTGKRHGENPVRHCFCRSLFLVLLLAAAPAQGADLGQIAESVGKSILTGIAVDRILAPEANNLLNGILRKNSLSTVMATKVVPVIGAGQGVRAGMAQIAGPTELVELVRAVAEIEFASRGTKMRGRVYIPVDSANPLGRIGRVDGVGVSALFDYRF